MSVGLSQQSVGLQLKYGENGNGGIDVEKTSVFHERMYHIRDGFYGFAHGRLTAGGLASDPLSPRDNATFADLDRNLKRDACFGPRPGSHTISTDNTLGVPLVCGFPDVSLL